MSERTLTIKQWWADNQQALMERICLILDGDKDAFDRGENYSASRWQIGSGNDWWAFVTQGEAPTLTISCRYTYNEPKLDALVNYLKFIL